MRIRVLLTIVIAVFSVSLLAGCGNRDEYSSGESYMIIDQPEDVKEVVEEDIPKDAPKNTEQVEPTATVDSNAPKSPAEDPALKEESNTSSQPGQSAGDTNKAESLGPAMESTVIDQNKYEKIEIGMTYGDVVSIIGSEGTLSASSDEGGIKHETFEWKSKDNKVVSISFENGKSVSKKGM